MPWRHLADRVIRHRIAKVDCLPRAIPAAAAPQLDPNACAFAVESVSSTLQYITYCLQALALRLHFADEHQLFAGKRAFVARLLPERARLAIRASAHRQTPRSTSGTLDKITRT